jgi:antitoxin component YwqK of YwqJK toxin-antitoxin module
MKQLLFHLFILSSIPCLSQDTKFVKYFDSLWQPIDKTKAQFYTEFVKQNELYHCTSYWLKTKKVQCKSIFKDTLFRMPAGLLVRYYESGIIEDSMMYENNGVKKEVFHFYKNGKLWAHCTYKLKNETCEGFDEEGKPITDFIYLREAEFPGGLAEWAKYLQNSTRKFNPAKMGAPEGNHKVMLRFTIDENGKVIDIEPETNIGYGMEEKAIDIIKRSPKWLPRIYLGKTTKAYRRQPFAFVVSPE